MLALSRKHTAFTAFDIDHDLLRVATVKRTNEGLAAAFKEARIPDGLLEKELVTTEGQAQLAELLSGLFKELRAPTTAVLAASPDRYTTLKKETFPPIKGKALLTAAKQRAGEITPHASHELSVGFLPTPSRTKKEVQGLVVALPLTVLDTLSNVVKVAGGNLVRLEPSVFALANLLLARGNAENGNGGGERLQLVVHLRHSRVGLALLHENRVLLARFGTAGVGALDRLPTMQLLTDEINATLQEFRVLSKEPPQALITGRQADDPRVIEAVEKAEVEVLPGIDATGFEVTHDGGSLAANAILLGLAVGRLA